MSKKYTDAEIREALTECFNKFDADRSGQLDFKEIYSVLEQLNKSCYCKDKMSQSQMESHVKSLIKEVDKNSDNKISKDEFINYFLPYLRD